MFRSSTFNTCHLVNVCYSYMPGWTGEGWTQSYISVYIRQESCGWTLRVFAGVCRWRTFCFGRRLSVDDLTVVVTLTSLVRSIVAPLLAAYRGAAAGCLFFSFFVHIITSMFYHLLSVTCCGMPSRLINKRRYTTITMWLGNKCIDRVPLFDRHRLP